MNTNEIELALTCFTGTTAYHKHQIVNGLSLNLTDGCHYLRDATKSYWLFDLILSYQLKEAFQVWKLKRIETTHFEVICEDGNDNLLVKQDISFSDFPLDSIKIWVVNGVAMLPSEY